MGRRLAYIAVACILFLTIACQGRADGEVRMQVDSLNARAYRLRYADVAAVTRLSAQALQLADAYPDGRNEARCNLAYAQYQRMDFGGVDSILQQVRQDSHNRLLLLCADVMQMKTTQRTGHGQQFYEAKSRAEGHIRHFRGREEKLTTRERRILVYAQTEFYIISSTYHYYLEQDSMARAEIAQVEPCFRLSVDTAQWIYYNYMMGSGSLVVGKDERAIVAREFDFLFNAYMLSMREQLPYFEANSLQALAVMCLHHGEFLRLEKPQGIRILSALLTEGDTLSADLPLDMCHRALTLFRQYHDLFQTACTYRTLGEIYFERGEYARSLDSYAQALHCVNEHHLRYYGTFSPDTLSAFNPQALERSVETEWMADDRIATVPEWIAGIRQQFSLTYSALGMRQASDYNRNFYLDLIQSTNQNLELENRTVELRHQTRALYGRMLLALVLTLLAVVMFVLLRRRLKRQSNYNIERLERTLDYLQRGEVEPGALLREEGSLRPYQSFLAWNKALLAGLEEELEEASEQLQVSRHRLTGNKRKNAESRAKVSLVHGIVPFLDRIGGEVLRMQQEGRVRPERRAYIRELVEEIDQHNQVLTDWIKMEQGALTLHITTVTLERLFHIIAEGHYAFDQKQVTLRVEPTQLLVKADESLTLFMLNTLADNARKFTPAGGTVTLVAREIEEDYVEVSVTDTGCGLPEADVETLNHTHVYDAAEIGKAHAEGKGYGFGLMNCRGIIEKYKKTSVLFSRCAFGVRSKVGEGSTFYFRLPRVLRMLFLLLTLSSAVSGHAAELEEETLYRAVFEANLDGRFEDAIQYARQALTVISQAHPHNPALLLNDTTAAMHEAAEMLWAQQGVTADYPLIVNLRNEVALAALALRDWPLYQYNNRVCVRLHKYIHLDKTLPDYYHHLKRTHRNSNLLLFFILLAAVAVLVLAYRLLLSTQVKIGRNIDELSDYCLHLLTVARTEPTLADFLHRTPLPQENATWAERYRWQIAETAVKPANSLRANIARERDEQARLAYEENRLYVQNQVLDNCLSAIKHESMYYPSRIRLLVEKMQDTDIGQLDELVRYYHHIYTLLCQQADAQVSQPGFRRQRVEVERVLGQVAATVARAETPVEVLHLTVLADETLLALLLESLLAGMQHDGAAITLRAEADGDFVRFVLQDTAATLPSEQLAGLFFPATGHIPFLVAKQILREHDAYCNHPGLRLQAEVCQGGGYEIYFTLLKSWNHSK